MIKHPNPGNIKFTGLEKLEMENTRFISFHDMATGFKAILKDAIPPVNCRCGMPLETNKCEHCRRINKW